jgi:hypothetical protein
MVFRFPNPGSDLDRMLRIFSLIVNAANDQEVDEFDLDFMVKVTASNFQASSRGAIGNTAIARSTQSDRSRDPLYNQLKMYSEIYRNMGLLRPLDQRLKFRVTALGQSLSVDFEGDEIGKGIARECLLAMTFPNATSHNLGIINLRPFRWLMMLIAELDGKITRHEMILGLLDVEDDRAPGVFEEKLQLILGLRQQGRSDLMAAITRVASSSNIQVNTLENYTRFPVGVLKSPITSWAESKRLSGIYDRGMDGLELSDTGMVFAKSLAAKIDVRNCDLQGFQLEERMQFARYSYYSLLYRSGLNQKDLLDEIEVSRIGSKSVLEHFAIESPDSFIFSPHLEESDQVLSLAESGT